MKAKVYFTRALTPEKVVEAYEKLGRLRKSTVPLLNATPHTEMLPAE